MAAPQMHPNGLGGSTPGVLSSLGPLYTSGTVYFVDSATGSNSNAGTDRKKPLASFVRATQLAADNDIIVMLEGHVETISPGLAVSQAGLTIVGEGFGSSRPKLFKGVTADDMIDFFGDGSWIDNVYFPAGTVLNSGSRVFMTHGARISNCYFEMGALDLTECIKLFGTFDVLRDVIVVSTAQSPAVPTDQAIVGSAATDVFADGITVDGGISGWTAAPISLTGAALRGRWTNVDLLGDSDFSLATGSTGLVHVRHEGGSARVVWAA